MSGHELGSALVTIARSAIAERLGLAGAEAAAHAALRQPHATFVTLRLAGELRGCVGSLRPVRALADDVRENAVAAAFRDPRFAPLAPSEFRSTSIEVSLLSADEPIEAASEDDLLASLRPGIDGLILQYGALRATFLPQVWEALAGRREFLAALKRKAGLPEDFWNPALNVSRYTVTKWAEPDLSPAGAQ